MHRITTAMISRYMPSLLNANAEGSQVPDAITQMVARKCVADNDANKDGKLDADEVSISQEAFDRLDADKDGRLTYAEIKSHLAEQGDALQSYIKAYKQVRSKNTLTEIMNREEAAGASLAQDTARKYIANKDANKDGKLTADEVRLTAEDFAKLDANGDKKIDQAEMTAYLRGFQAELSQYYAGKKKSV